MRVSELEGGGTRGVKVKGAQCPASLVLIALGRRGRALANNTAAAVNASNAAPAARAHQRMRPIYTAPASGPHQRLHLGMMTESMT